MGREYFAGRKASLLKRRLAYCMKMAKCYHSDRINMFWLEWFGNWGNVWSALEKLRKRSSLERRRYAQSR